MKNLREQEMFSYNTHIGLLFRLISLFKLKKKKKIILLKVYILNCSCENK